MESFLEILRWLIVCGAILSFAFLILLALPNSRLRAFLLPIVGWGMAIFCAIYCVSPVDIVPEIFLGPFGLVDDIGAVFLGVAGASTAINAKKETD